MSSFLGLGNGRNECAYLYIFPKVVLCLAILGVGTGMGVKIDPLSPHLALKVVVALGVVQALEVQKCQWT